MTRYRLVSQSNRSPGPHVSSVVIAQDEIEEQLDAEAFLHRLNGWTVTPGEEMLVCRKGQLTRVISVRESSPMNDET